MRNEAPVPEGWQVARLGDVACERNQRANSGPQAEVFSVTKHSGFVRSLEYFGRQVFSRDTSNYKIVRRGDLAYATIHLDEGSLGILRDTEIGMISPMYTVFEVDRTQTEPEFLFSLMKLPQMVAKYTRIGEGSVHRRKSISFENLSRLSMVIPVLAEQRRILAVLDSIDEAIESAEAVIAATERLRDALLHELLTRGVPGWHSEWKDAPGVGTIPACWNVVRLGDVADWVNGLAFRDIQFNEIGKPIIRIAELKAGITTETKFTEQCFDQTVHIRPGDLLFAWSGQPETSINAFWWNGPEGWLNQHIFRVKTRSQVNTTFFYYLLRHLNSVFVRIARGKQTAGLGHVTKEELFKTVAAFPPKEEQQAVAAALGGVDEAIASVTAETDVLRSLKASTTDALLTGQVRVAACK